jgi:glycosyltransferase involved in cell wall biosynthesis
MSRDPIDMLWLQSREMVEKLRKAIEDSEFDVIHFDTLGLTPYKSVVKTAKTVLNHHNVESSMMSRRASKERNRFVAQYFKLQAGKLREAEKRWCPQFGTNLVVSAEEELELNKWAPDANTAVVPNGVDTEYFTPRPDPAGRRLLFCGGLDWYANRDAMVFFFNAIWPLLGSQVPDVEIYVVGRRPPKWLQRLGERDRRVHVTGFVEDVRPYFKKAAAYVCPIREGGGTRLKVLDALAMGVPLIGTSFACSGLRLSDGKHVLFAETPQEFISKIGQVFDDSELRHRLAAAGRKVIEREYSWRAIGETLIDAYKSVSQVKAVAKGREGLGKHIEISPHTSTALG